MAFGESFVHISGYMMTIRNGGNYSTFAFREMVEAAFQQQLCKLHYLIFHSITPLASATVQAPVRGRVAGLGVNKQRKPRRRSPSGKGPRAMDNKVPGVKYVKRYKRCRD